MRKHNGGHTHSITYPKNVFNPLLEYGLWSTQNGVVFLFRITYSVGVYFPQLHYPICGKAGWVKVVRFASLTAHAGEEFFDGAGGVVLGLANGLVEVHGGGEDGRIAHFVQCVGDPLPFQGWKEFRAGLGNLLVSVSCVCFKRKGKMIAQVSLPGEKLPDTLDIVLQTGKVPFKIQKSGEAQPEMIVKLDEKFPPHAFGKLPPGFFQRQPIRAVLLFHLLEGGPVEGIRQGVKLAGSKRAGKFLADEVENQVRIGFTRINDLNVVGGVGVDFCQRAFLRFPFGNNGLGHETDKIVSQRPPGLVIGKGVFGGDLREDFGGGGHCKIEYNRNMVINVPPSIAKISPDGNLTPRQKRQFLIQMALRRVKPGTGSAPVFMKERTAMQNWPDLREILDGMDWVIIGGVATRAYMPERLTKDLDILVRSSDGDEVIERLKKAGYKLVSRLAVPGYLMRSREGVDVDVLFGNYPWLEEALAHPQRDAAGFPVIALPYLVVLKLSANRFRDISDLLGWAAEKDLDSVREMVRRYLPGEKDDLESMIFLGQHEQKESPDWHQKT
jgi:hypothetical protein